MNGPPDEKEGTTLSSQNVEQEMHMMDPGLLRWVHLLPYSLRLLALGSSFLFISSVAFCLLFCIVSTIFLPYRPIHLHFFQKPLHPIPELQVEV